jgi:hypothetical protein
MSAASKIAAAAATAPRAATLPTTPGQRTELGNQSLACMKDVVKEVSLSSTLPPGDTGRECRRHGDRLLSQRPSTASEIRLVRDRDVVVKQVLVVLGADVFTQWLLHAAVTLDRRPWLIESIRVINREIHF